jgi:ABC-type Mn2+/Zn2+ transport system ATPase subunit
MTSFHTHAEPRFPYGGRRHRHPHVFARALDVDGVTVRYGSREVVTDISFALPEGTLAALVGPNGAGKSTLLKAIAKLAPLTAGQIRILGLPPGGCHHRTAYLPQRGDIDWNFPVTAERFTLAGRYVHLGWFRRPRPSDHAIVARVLDRLGLSSFTTRRISELSGGQQQRLLIARALAQGADLLLLDEPFNNLDAATRRDLLSLFRELRDAKKTLLIATHDFDEPSAQFDEVISLNHGRRVLDAVPA